MLNSEKYRCSEEILSIAAMTSVQNVFVTAEGEAGAYAELEKRKFTAEEGVSPFFPSDACLPFPALVLA